MPRVKLQERKGWARLSCVPPTFIPCTRFCEYIRDNAEEYCETAYAVLDIDKLRLTGIVRPFVLRDFRLSMSGLLANSMHLTEKISVPHKIWKFSNNGSPETDYAVMSHDIAVNFMSSLGLHLRTVTQPPPGKTYASSIAYKRYANHSGYSLSRADAMRKYQGVYRFICREIGLFI